MNKNLNQINIGFLYILTLLVSSKISFASSGEFESNDVSGMHNLIGSTRILSNFEFILSVCILLFGIIIIFLQYLMFRSDKSRFQSIDVLRTHSITIILIGGLLFVTASYDAEQIAPAVGLFGTIAGYLLGKSHGDKSADK